ncbi:hypothetical protein C8F04DRAFT_1184806 [Mycena alexandri]|uniref:Uncharacterized protein n=1 Tax=Mycena alexandri TaxID=1745969 RepID=A0AAD6ST56_9AGAR|nr:hypothetical protein C8F04DRAFT_1184806 [Mycena alexandri]
MIQHDGGEKDLIDGTSANLGGDLILESLWEAAGAAQAAPLACAGSLRRSKQRRKISSTRPACPECLCRHALEVNDPSKPSPQKRVQSNAITTPPAQSRSPSPHSAGAGEGSDYEEPENEDEDGDKKNNGSGPDENSADEAVTQNAFNARATHWQPWQDRILTQQVNVNPPFLLEDPQERAVAWDATANAVNAAVSKSATRPWTPRTGEACCKRLQRLMKNHKLLGKICALADGEVVATARKVKKKNDLEAQSGAEMRDALMKGLVKSAGCNCTGADLTLHLTGIGSFLFIVKTVKVVADAFGTLCYILQLFVVASGVERNFVLLEASIDDVLQSTYTFLAVLDRREEQIQRRERELQNVK